MSDTIQEALEGELRQSGITKGVCMEAVGKAMAHAGSTVTLVFPKNTIREIVDSTEAIIHDIVEKNGNSISGKSLKGFKIEKVFCNNRYVIHISTDFYGSYSIINKNEHTRATKQQYDALRPFVEYQPTIL